MCLDPHSGCEFGKAPRRVTVPDLTGTTIGKWRVLYEMELEEKRHCMCQCEGCGVRKVISFSKIRKGYALRCPECRIRRELSGM